MYTPDIFYDTSKLDYDKKKEILVEAKRICYDWSVNTLVGFQRQHIDMSFDDIMSKFNNAAHFVVVHRRGYPDNGSGVWKWKLEVGFSTMYGSTFYLFIYVEEELIPGFVEKFKLTSKDN